jgi:hypothetical protein
MTEGRRRASRLAFHADLDCIACMSLNAAKREFLAALANVVLGNPLSAAPCALAHEDAERRGTGGSSSRRCSTSATTASCRRSTRISSARQPARASRSRCRSATTRLPSSCASGFPEDAAARYLAPCFQLPRAFYFIHRSLAGECEWMRRLRESLWNNVFTHDMRGYDAALWNRMENFSTLLLGETGTGKGQAAAAIGIWPASPAPGRRGPRG